MGADLGGGGWGGQSVLHAKKLSPIFSVQFASQLSDNDQRRLSGLFIPPQGK